MSKSIPVRLDDECVAALDARAQADGSTRSALIARAVDELLHPQVTVPEATVPPGIDCLIELSKTQIASMDQTAERVQMTRKQWIERVLSERIRREFVFERQKQAFH